MSQTINAEQWTLYDKVLYGGLGYGAFCLPTDFFKVIIAIMFPPLGEVINIIEDTVDSSFPYLNWATIQKLCRYKSLNTIVYSFVLTTLFYIPGLIYTLTNIVNKERNISYDPNGSIIYDANNDDNDTEYMRRKNKEHNEIIDESNNVIGNIKTGANIIDRGVNTGANLTGDAISSSGRTAGQGVNAGANLTGNAISSSGRTAGQGVKSGANSAVNAISSSIGSLW